MSQRDDLQLEIEVLEEEAAAFRRQGNETGYNLKKTEAAQKRAEIEAQQLREEAIEEKVHAEAVPFAVAGIDFTGLPAEVITLIDAVVKTDRRRMLNEHSVELEKEEQAFKKLQGHLDQTLKEADEIQEAFDEQGLEIARLKDENYKLAMDKEDAEGKRDAAMDARAEALDALKVAQTEIERLKSELEDYQRAKVFGERESQQIIDITPNESADISAAVAAVKKLYSAVEDWGSVQKVIKPDGSFELVKRAEFNEQWEAAEGQNSFRSEDTATNTQEPAVPAAEELGIVPPIFRDEGQPPVVEGESNEVGQVATETIEERVAKLERAVFGQVQGEAA